jgi:hypothetical protein
MTPKEKAKELYDNYRVKCFGHIAYKSITKQCALIAVDELIKYAKTFGDVTELDIQHFKDIKKEIELL